MSRLRRGLCGTTATTTETSVVCSYIFNPITSSLGRPNLKKEPTNVISDESHSEGSSNSKKLIPPL